MSTVTETTLLTAVSELSPARELSSATATVRDPATASVPVIAYTAMPAFVRDGEELFAAVCAKPCPPDELLKVVAEFAPLK